MGALLHAVRARATRALSHRHDALGCQARRARRQPARRQLRRRLRRLALALALVSLGFVCYQHPFFGFVWREGGEWKYDEAKMRKSMPHVALPKGSSPLDLDHFEPWHILDLHRSRFGPDNCGRHVLT